jgi:hypothetical protein
MIRRMTAGTLALALAAPVLLAQEESRRATFRNIGGDWGKCTIEIEVDDLAEVAISGDEGRIRTLAGSPSIWRRFECSGPIPARPGDFRFRGIDGRGRVNLVRDPRDNRGIAVVRIDDRKGGREGYTFDLEWRGGDDRPGRSGFDDRGSRNLAGAIQSCHDAVTSRLNRDGFRDVRFQSTSTDDRRGRDRGISGTLTARDGRNTAAFDFACAIDLRSGRIGDIEVVRR